MSVFTAPGRDSWKRSLEEASANIVVFVRFTFFGGTGGLFDAILADGVSLLAVGDLFLGTGFGVVTAPTFASCVFRFGGSVVSFGVALDFNVVG